MFKDNQHHVSKWDECLTTRFHYSWLHLSLAYCPQCVPVWSPAWYVSVWRSWRTALAPPGHWAPPGWGCRAVLGASGYGGGTGEGWMLSYGSVLQAESTNRYRYCYGPIITVDSLCVTSMSKPHEAKSISAMQHFLITFTCYWNAYSQKTKQNLNHISVVITMLFADWNSEVIPYSHY